MSADTKYTPGPWQQDPVVAHEIQTAYGSPTPFEIVAEVARKPSWREMEANATLIAAAPDLLEVAHIEHELQMGGYTKATARKLGREAEDAFLSGGTPALNDWRRRKREAAIAKAEGR